MQTCDKKNCCGDKNKSTIKKKRYGQNKTVLSKNKRESYFFIKYLCDM